MLRPWLTTLAPIVLDRLRRRQRAQEIAEVVGERMKLEPYRVGGERSARQSRPLDRTLAFLDPLLGRATLVVESDDPLGWTAHVRHDEANPGIKLARMPLDFGDHPALSAEHVDSGNTLRMQRRRRNIGRLHADTGPAFDNGRTIWQLPLVLSWRSGPKTWSAH